MSSSNIKLSFIDISLILSCIFSNISVLEIGAHEYITDLSFLYVLEVRSFYLNLIVFS